MVYILDLKAFHHDHDHTSVLRMLYICIYFPLCLSDESETGNDFKGRNPCARLSVHDLDPLKDRVTPQTLLRNTIFYIILVTAYFPVVTKSRTTLKTSIHLTFDFWIV